MNVHNTKLNFIVEMMKLKPYLERFAFSLARSSDEADDLVQTTLIKGWINRNEFQQDRSVKVWLRTFLMNTFNDENRRKRRAAIPFSEMLERDDVDDPASVLPDPATINGHGQLSGFFLEEIYAAIHNLKPEHRELISLVVEIQSQSQKAIADILGVPRGTVKSRLSRARDALSKILSEAGYDVVERGVHVLNEEVEVNYRAEPTSVNSDVPAASKVKELKQYPFFNLISCVNEICYSVKILTTEDLTNALTRINTKNTQTHLMRQYVSIFANGGMYSEHSGLPKWFPSLVARLVNLDPTTVYEPIFKRMTHDARAYWQTAIKEADPNYVAPAKPKFRKPTLVKASKPATDRPYLETTAPATNELLGDLREQFKPVAEELAARPEITSVQDVLYLIPEKYRPSLASFAASLRELVETKEPRREDGKFKISASMLSLALTPGQPLTKLWGLSATNCASISIPPKPASTHLSTPAASPTT